MDWATLPKELLATIFSFSSCADLTRAVCVNSTWNSLAKSENIWKDAIMNNPFPHPHSYDEKNVSWRLLAQRHLVTKKNIINRRCVQYTLGTRCPTSKTRADIILRKRTANERYCLLIWEVMESHGYSYTTHDHLATELWDLEKRTIIRNYPQERMGLCNEFLEQNDLEYEDDASQLEYAKFDPTNLDEEFVLDKKIKIENFDYGYVSLVKNEDKNNSLIVLTWANWSTKKKFIHVYDLRTGAKILDKTLDDTTHWSVEQLIGSKLMIRNGDKERVLVLDVLQDKEILIKEPLSSCATILGNDLWIACSTNKSLIKYDLTTMKRLVYKVGEEISNALDMRVLDGIIWLFTYGPRIALIDVSSTTKSEILTWISMPGWDRPNITHSANGTLVCLGTSYAHILSFKDEDIALPIQALLIKTSGENKIMQMRHGDLNKKVAEFTPALVSSEIVFEDETQRYCIIYSFNDKKYEHNKYVDIAREWLDKDKVEYHKTAIFQLVHFDLKDKSVTHPRTTRPTAFGPCWVIYETKIDGAWHRTSPVDEWSFFKNKLGLK